VYSNFVNLKSYPLWQQDVVGVSFPLAVALDSEEHVIAAETFVGIVMTLVIADVHLHRRVSSSESVQTQ
jgi:hypothetical protein